MSLAYCEEHSCAQGLGHLKLSKIPSLWFTHRTLLQPLDPNTPVSFTVQSGNGVMAVLTQVYAHGNLGGSLFLTGHLNHSKEEIELSVQKEP